MADRLRWRRRRAARSTGHRIEARVTQPFGSQDYSFALSVDGRLEPGSDDLPAPSTVKRSTLRGAAALVLVIFVVTLVTSLLRHM